MTAPWTQTISLDWRPALRFFEVRFELLRELEDAGHLVAFRVEDNEFGAFLFDRHHEITVRHDGLIFDTLMPDARIEEAWTVIDQIFSKVAPSRLNDISFKFQHVAELQVEFEDAMARGYGRIFQGLELDRVFTDWAMLADFKLPGIPEHRAQSEFGIVTPREVPARLGRLVGRTRSGGQRNPSTWDHEMFKPVSLFVDSGVDVSPHGWNPDHEVLDPVKNLWTTCQGQVEINRLVDQLQAATKRRRAEGRSGMSSALMKAPVFNDVKRDWVELDPPVQHSSHQAMRFGPRAYTDEQFAFIDQASSEVRALPAAALPLPADF